MATRKRLPAASIPRKSRACASSTFRSVTSNRCGNCSQVPTLPPRSSTVASARDFRGNDAAGSRLRVALGDACDLGRYEDASFDIVFSNSVIEHIGDASRVARFAREVRRVGRSYWVQTPSWLFPIEAHTGLPFFWLYPAPLREVLASRHDRRYAMNPWSCPMAQTRCFRLRELRALFPDAAVYTERVAGLAKSWSLYRRSPCA